VPGNNTHDAILRRMKFVSWTQDGDFGIANSRDFERALPPPIVHDFMHQHEPKNLLQIRKVARSEP
jgi:hypothetical protein